MFIRVNSSLKRTSSFLKHVPLSDIIKLGIPLLEINRFRAQMNDDAVRLGTTSRLTALVTAHVNKIIRDL